MKKTIGTALMAALLAVLPLPAQKPEEPETLLQIGIKKENVDGNLAGAIEAYKHALAAAKGNRAVAAMALVHMAECYRKTGDAEARKFYEQVLRDYADQKEAVTLARSRMAAGRDPVPAGIVTRQVWADAQDTEGTPSPDGRYLSFVDWTTGDLAIRDLASGENRRLTNKGPWEQSEAFALFSVFSPDGAQLVYTWFNGDDKHSWDLRVVSTQGAGIPKPHVLLHRDDHLEPYGWSKDGSILVLLDRADLTHQIALISAADGAPRILKTFDWRAPTKLSLSPDGRYVAYDFPPREDSPKRDIFLLATDGSRESVAVAHPANDLNPVWTPDGSALVFTSDRSGSTSAWAVAVSDGKVHGEPELIKSDVGVMSPMAFTRKGALYYSLHMGDSGVYVASLDLAGRKMQGVERITERFSGANMNPEWSPDGRYLAYVSRRVFDQAPGNNVICIRKMDTGEQRELKPELAYFQAVRWSPDGKSLATWGSDRKGRKGIYLVDGASGKVTPVTTTGDDFRNPRWSPDGRTLYFHDYLTGRVVAHRRDTGEERDLFPAGRLKPGRLALSPDGSQLAMTVAHPETKSTGIVLISTAGGSSREIVNLPLMPRVLSWMPDGKQLLFSRDETGKTDLWLVPAAGGEPAKILQIDQRILGFGFDSKVERVAYNTGESKSEIWVMENFLPALAARK